MDCCFNAILKALKYSLQKIYSKDFVFGDIFFISFVVFENFLSNNMLNCSMFSKFSISYFSLFKDSVNSSNVSLFLIFSSFISMY